jgi:hypothetical protein
MPAHFLSGLVSIAHTAAKYPLIVGECMNYLVILRISYDNAQYSCHRCKTIYKYVKYVKSVGAASSMLYSYKHTEYKCLLRTCKRNSTVGCQTRLNFAN